MHPPVKAFFHQLFRDIVLILSSPPPSPPHPDPDVENCRVCVTISNHFSKTQFNRSDVGIGTIVGSAVFNVLFVIGMCAIFSKDLLQLTWWPLFRDCMWYMLALALVGGFFANQDGQTIVWWEALLLFLLYGCYVFFMANNEAAERFVKLRLIPASWGLSGDMIAEDMADPNAAEEEAATGSGGGGVGSDVEEDEDETDTSNDGFRKPTVFRAGILKLLSQDHFEVENLGVHMVAKIKGDAAQVFKKVDSNRDGVLSGEEVKNVLREAGLDHSPLAVAKAVAEMESSENNGQVCRCFFKVLRCVGASNISRASQKLC
jgi:sodium/potassium/calcium exchanger 2